MVDTPDAQAQPQQAPAHEHAAKQPPPTMEQIAAMEEASVGDSLKMAKEFVKNLNTVYHHYLTNGGLRSIADSEFMGGAGTASFQQTASSGLSVDRRPRAGRASQHANTPVIEFTTAGGEIPDVRLYQSRPGAYWTVDALKVNIKSIHYPDGTVAVPKGGGMFEVTRVDGKSAHVSAKELPE